MGFLRRSNRNCIVIICLCLTGIVCAQTSSSQYKQTNELAKNGFIQIPGPNPVLMFGQDDRWKTAAIECCDAIKDQDTYYLYYHGMDGGWRIGVATSKNPLGPFVNYENNPILPVGPKGSWDEDSAACAMVLKEGYMRWEYPPEEDKHKYHNTNDVIKHYSIKYYMFYSGIGNPPEHNGQWDIGLAYADSPLGPWKKYENNPVLKDFGYLGSVVKVDGKYYLYSAEPIGSVAPDYSPFSVAVADKPQGPWRPYYGNPVLLKGNPGEWDAGGASEAEILYHGGLFHTFYGAGVHHPNRMLKRENLGYAYSYNGFDWIKYSLNPVASLAANPYVACFGEVHSIIEYPYIYIYHTQRYTQPCTIKGRARGFGNEDLGVQVLVAGDSFSLDMPLINLDKLEPGRTTSLDETAPVNLTHVKRLLLTAKCDYDKDASQPLKIHIKSSTDGLNYDTINLYTLEHDLVKGQTVQKSFEINTNARFIKVQAENPDQSQIVTNLSISAALGS